MGGKRDFICSDIDGTLFNNDQLCIRPESIRGTHFTLNTNRRSVRPIFRSFYTELAAIDPYYRSEAGVWVPDHAVATGSIRMRSVYGKEGVDEQITYAARFNESQKQYFIDLLLKESGNGFKNIHLFEFPLIKELNGVDRIVLYKIYPKREDGYDQFAKYKEACGVGDEERGFVIRENGHRENTDTEDISVIELQELICGAHIPMMVVGFRDPKRELPQLFREANKHFNSENKSVQMVHEDDFIRFIAEGSDKGTSYDCLLGDPSQWRFHWAAGDKPVDLSLILAAITKPNGFAFYVHHGRYTNRILTALTDPRDVETLESNIDKVVFVPKPCDISSRIAYYKREENVRALLGIHQFSGVS